MNFFVINPSNSVLKIEASAFMEQANELVEDAKVNKHEVIFVLSSKGTIFVINPLLKNQ